MPDYTFFPLVAVRLAARSLAVNWAQNRLADANATMVLITDKLTAYGRMQWTVGTWSPPHSVRCPVCRDVISRPFKRY